MAQNGWRMTVFISSLFLGLYLLNSVFLWIKLPVQAQLLDNIFLTLSGALIIVLGIAYSFRRRYVV